MKFIKRFSRKPAAPRPVVASAAAPLLMALEPRIMFDASVGVVAEVAAEQTAVDTSSDHSATDTPATAAADTRSQQSNSRQEVVFVDGGVANVEQLLAGLTGNPEVVILDPNKDGLQQMADYLKGREGLDAIHLLSHGAEGKVQVGNVWLSSGNLADHRAALESIGAALNADGDLLLYGCDVGVNAKGQVFLDEMASITGADLAASDDATGAAVMGGDWELEARVGKIDADALSINGYQGLFQVIEFTDADADYSSTVITKTIDGRTFTFTGGTGFGGLGMDPSYGSVGLYAYEGTNGGNDTKLTISVESGYMFDLSAFDAGIASGSLTIALTYANGTTTNFTVNSPKDAWHTLDAFGTPTTHVTQVVLSSNDFGLFQNIEFINVRAIPAPPTVIDANIAVTSTPTGTGATYKIGDTVTVTWANAADSEVTGVTMDFSQFGGGTVVVATDQGNGTWRASYTITAGSIEASNRNVSVTVANAGGTTTTADTTNARVDNVAPATTFSTLSLSADTGVSRSDFITNTASQTISATLSTTLSGNDKAYGSLDDGVTWIDITSKVSGTTLTWDGDNLSAGSHAVNLKVVDAAGNQGGVFRQVYTLDTSAPAASSIPQLSSSSDSGSSSTDNITNVTTPTFTGTAEAGSTVTLYDTDGTTVLGTATAVGGVWTIISASLAAGSHTLTAKATDLAGNVSNVSSGQTITIDTTAPTGLSVSQSTITSSNASSGATIATLSASDDLPITYSFASGNGANGADNGSFVISGNSLQVGGAQLSTGTYQLYISATDAAGNVSYMAQAISVVNAPVVNRPPTLTATADNPTFTENGAAVTLFSGVAANTNDIGQTFTGAQFIVSNVADSTEYLTIHGVNVALSNGNSVSLGSGYGTASVSRSGGMASITLSGATLSNADMSSLLSGMTYGNSSDDPGSATRTVTLTQLTDSGSSDNTVSTSISSAVTVVPVNDAPFIEYTSVNKYFNENTAVRFSAPDFSFKDVDSGDTLQSITIVDAPNAGHLFIDANGNGVYDSGDTLLGNGAVVSAANIGKLTFRPLENANGSSYASFTWKVSDGITTSANVGTMTFNVIAVNDAPVVTVSGGSASWTEGNNVASTPVVVDPGLTLSDADGPNPLNATVRLLTYYSSQDSLAFVNDGLSMGNILGTWSAGTGILTLTSAGNLATTAEFQAAMRAVTYGNSSDTPNTTSRTIQFQITDGGSLSSIAVTRDVTIVAVNDSPTISAPVLQSITEDIPTALGSITFSDVDSTLGIVTFSLGAGTGTLSATGAGGVTVGGTATALTLSGTLANINQFIASNRLLYTPVANASGDVTLTINVNTTSVSDATTTMTLQVQAVNDAPVATVPPSITVTEDVSSVITGISFTDIDVGINAVTATFSVPSGTLSATTGLGVTVGGSGTGLLTLTGSLADINFFIAANGLTFKTAQDVTASVILTVSINDGGFSGAGGAQTDTKTVTLNVTAVNDAPVNNVPGAQTASQNVVLGFNTANGNAISISDVDSGNGLMTVTLTAVNGTLTLSNLSGINMVNGTGLNNVTMTIEGNRTNINAALQTLTFKGATNYIGAASVTIETNDNGNSGTGGAKTDVDTISINVIPVNPKVTNVSAQGLDRTVRIGDDVLISMTWDQVVNVDLSGGIPSLLLETGLVDRNAIYVSGSGSNTLVFRYTVQAGDVSADLDFQSTAALQMNGAVISNNTSDLAILTLPTVGGADSLGGRSNIVVDGVVPVVGSVFAPMDGTYITGQNLDFTVNFSENVLVATSTGVPRIAVTLDTGGTVYAEYVSGSGSSALVFRMTVLSGQLDSNGVTLGSAIDTNGGAITDLAGNSTVTTLNGVASTAGVNIDGIAPSVLNITTPLDKHYRAGDTLILTVNTSEAVQTGSMPPRLVLDVGGVTRYANYVSGSGSNMLVFQYTVQADDSDSDGITVDSLDLRGEQLTDLAGNDLDLSGASTSTDIVIDNIAPAAVSITRGDASPNSSSSVRFTVTFNEDVRGVDSSDFSLIFGGTAAGTITSVTAVNGRTYTVLVGNLTGTGSLRLDLNDSGTGVTDLAGNGISGGLAGASYSIDRTVPTEPGVPSVPSITGVSVPADGTYVAGQVLDFTVNMSETVQLNTSNGSPRLEITLDNGSKAYATYLSGAGSSALVFRMTVVAGQLDTNGIVLGNSIQLNGATLRDSLGNDVPTTLSGLPGTERILIDAVVPTVASVMLPPAGAYRVGDVLSFTVNVSENVNVDTRNGTPLLALNIGGVTQYAQYVSGSGSNALVFVYSIQSGNNSASGIMLGSSIEFNGGSLRDAAGNSLNPTLNAAGNGVGVVIDTAAPLATSIVVEGAYQPTDRSLSFILTFNEAVSGVDASDFSVIGTAGSTGTVQSVQQIDAQTYRIVIGNISGQGSLSLGLNAPGSGIRDNVGNALSVSLTSQGQSIQTQEVGDLDYRTNPPAIADTPQGVLLQPQVPSFVSNGDALPLLPSSLFDVRSVGGDFQPLGTIFLGQAGSAPSFIAQVFGSSDSSIGSNGQGFFGFGGGNGGLFGSSTLAGIFSREVPDVSEMNVFNGSQWKQSDLNQGLRGVFGAPTLGQQLQQINEADQRHVRELAMALAQSTEIGQRT